MSLKIIRTPGRVNLFRGLLHLLPHRAAETFIEPQTASRTLHRRAAAAAVAGAVDADSVTRLGAFWSFLATFLLKK